MTSPCIAHPIQINTTFCYQRVLRRFIESVLTSILSFFYAGLALAFSTGVGLTAMEEGDDRYRPGVMVQFNSGSFDARLYYSSREFGPVFESTGLLSVTGGFPVPISSWLFAHTGIGILQEKTKIAYTLNDSSFDKSDVRYNLGMALGLRLKSHLTKDVHFEAGWDSFLFPAGVTGGILLSTGRKQIIFLGSGVQW